MRNYDYISHLDARLIDEFGGQINEIKSLEIQLRNKIESDRERFEKLRKKTLLESTQASLSIEGLEVSDDMAKVLVEEDYDIEANIDSLSKAEKEFLGYRDVLNTIHESYQYISISPNMILQLHRDLYRYVNPALGGNYRNACIFVNEVLANGESVPFFKPVAAYETKNSLEELCDHLRDLSSSNGHNLLLSIMFLLDFYVIHPFNFGNGEAMRFMTHLLFNRVDFKAFNYISYEKMLESDIKSLYLAVRESTLHYEQGITDYKPFITFILNLLKKAYLSLLD